jgi:UDP-perosamine 4-acetyltransferase
MNSDNSMPVIILGAGGHAKVLVNILRLTGRNIIGLLSTDVEPGSESCGSSVLGDESAVEQYTPEEIELVNGIGAVPGNTARWEQAYRMRGLGYRFANVVHPSAVIAEDAEIAEGVQVMAGAVIQPGVEVGVDAIINTGVLIDHDCVVGRRCHIAPGVVCSGNVQIGNGVHIGVGSSIIQGISIGQDSIVAAGSVVYGDIPDNVTFIQKRQPVYK